ncbi:MAG: hypothetical protein AAB467_03785 [Patescibacteria group bacterium]
MAITAEYLIQKYRERFRNAELVFQSQKHFDFWLDLAHLSEKEQNGKDKTSPPNIDAATELDEKDELIWLRRLANLPDRKQVAKNKTLPRRTF